MYMSVIYVCVFIDVDVIYTSEQRQSCTFKRSWVWSFWCDNGYATNAAFINYVCSTMVPNLMLSRDRQDRRTHSRGMKGCVRFVRVGSCKKNKANLYHINSIVYSRQFILHHLVFMCMYRDKTTTELAWNKLVLFYGMKFIYPTGQNNHDR